jgi:hypothetical protein
MSIQQLLAQLQSMGFTQDQLSGGLGGLTSEQIMQQSGQAVGLDTGQISEFLTPQMFQTLNPALLKSASMGAFSPIFQQKQQSLVPQLIAAQSGQEAKRAYGGFAGSGGATMQQQQAKDVYGKGMQDVLTQSMGAKTQSLGTIQDIINQWQATAQSFT